MLPAPAPLVSAARLAVLLGPQVGRIPGFDPAGEDGWLPPPLFLSRSQAQREIEMSTVNRVVIHARALERFRRRTGKSAAQILGESGLTVDDLRVGIGGAGFTLGDLERMAEALGITPRDLATASTVLIAAESLRAPSSSR